MRPWLFKDAVLSILATIAKQERIRLSEGVHAGLAKARRVRVGGPRLEVNRAKMLRLEEEGLSANQTRSPLEQRRTSGGRLAKTKKAMMWQNL